MVVTEEVNAVFSFAYALFGFQIRQISADREQMSPPEQVTLYGVGKRRAEPTTAEASRP